MAMLMIHPLVNMKKLLQDICSKIFCILLRGKSMICERWISSIQFSCSVVSNSLEPIDCGMPSFSVHNQLPELAQTLVRWVGDAIPPPHPVVFPFSSCLQSFLASGSFPMSQFFPSGGQSIGVSASASVLPMNIQDWSPLGWTGLISMLFKGLSRVFSNNTVQKHQCFFGAQLSLWSNSHIHAWLREKS